jgi:hypothetical protein
MYLDELDNLVTNSTWFKGKDHAYISAYGWRWAEKMNPEAAKLLRELYYERNKINTTSSFWDWIFRCFTRH